MSILETSRLGDVKGNQLTIWLFVSTGGRIPTVGGGRGGAPTPPSAAHSPGETTRIRARRRAMRLPTALKKTKQAALAVLLTIKLNPGPS